MNHWQVHLYCHISLIVIISLQDLSFTMSPFFYISYNNLRFDNFAQTPLLPTLIMEREYFLYQGKFLEIVYETKMMPKSSTG